MLVDLGLALVAIRRVRALDAQTGSDHTTSHLEAGYMPDTWMHRLGVNSSKTTITVVILECMITL